MRRSGSPRSSGGLVPLWLENPEFLGRRFALNWTGA